MCERQHAKTCLKRVHIAAAQSARKNGNGLFPFRKQTVLIPFGGDKRDRTADLLNAMERISILLQFLYYSMYHLKIQNAA